MHLSLFTIFYSSQVLCRFLVNFFNMKLDKYKRKVQEKQNESNVNFPMLTQFSAFTDLDTYGNWGK